jgi:hypothetical protein
MYQCFLESTNQILQLATKHSRVIPQSAFPNLCGFYTRDREIPARRAIPEKIGRFPEVHTFKNI